MYYTIYKVTNKISGKIYIGSHKTKDLNDNYMGSGKYLKRSIEKRGIENFDKEILYVFDNPESMYSMEAEIVNKDFIAEQNTYNLKVGGYGGWDYNNSNRDLYGHTTEHFKRMSVLGKEPRLKTWKRLFADKEYKEAWGKKSSYRQIKQYKNGRVPSMLGKKHTDETKQKISKAISGKQAKESNSQYNTRWIYSLDEQKSKKIKKDDQLPAEWQEGRKIKFD